MTNLEQYPSNGKHAFTALFFAERQRTTCKIHCFSHKPNIGEIFTCYAGRFLIDQILWTERGMAVLYVSQMIKSQNDGFELSTEGITAVRAMKHWLSVKDNDNVQAHVRAIEDGDYDRTP